jgi:hypothetical protein
MTLDDAIDAIGKRVVYRAEGRPDEFGFIVTVGTMLVFVRYGSDPRPKGTYPQDLELV